MHGICMLSFVSLVICDGRGPVKTSRRHGNEAEIGAGMVCHYHIYRCLGCAS